MYIHISIYMYVYIYIYIYIRQCNKRKKGFLNGHSPFCNRIVIRLTLTGRLRFVSRRLPHSAGNLRDIYIYRRQCNKRKKRVLKRSFAILQWNSHQVNPDRSASFRQQATASLGWEPMINQTRYRFKIQV